MIPRHANAVPDAPGTAPLPVVDAFRAIGALCLLLCLLFSPPAPASPLCETWPQVRDSNLVVHFDAIHRNFARALQEQKLWLGQLAEHRDQYSAGALKAQELADVLLLGLNITSQTVQVAVAASGKVVGDSIGLMIAGAIENLADSDSVEEAAHRMVAEKIGLSPLVSSVSILQSLLAAKDRFQDRKQTIRLLETVESTLQSNLRTAEAGLASSKTALKDLNDYRNRMDAACNVQAREWVFLGYRVADYAGPPKSYNKIPMKYGYYWVQRGPGHSDTRDRLRKEIKARHRGSYVDFFTKSARSNRYVSIYAITQDVGTWKSRPIEVTKYKMYAGKDEADIAKKLSKDAQEYKYKSSSRVEWIDLQAQHSSGASFFAVKQAE